MWGTMNDKPDQKKEDVMEQTKRIMERLVNTPHKPHEPLKKKDRKKNEKGNPR